VIKQLSADRILSLNPCTIFHRESLCSIVSLLVWDANAGLVVMMCSIRMGVLITVVRVSRSYDMMDVWLMLSIKNVME
jgi:hypothetical protein